MTIANGLIVNKIEFHMTKKGLCFLSWLLLMTMFFTRPLHAFPAKSVRLKVDCSTYPWLLAPVAYLGHEPVTYSEHALVAATSSVDGSAMFALHMQQINRPSNCAHRFFRFMLVAVLAVCHGSLDACLWQH